MKIKRLTVLFPLAFCVWGTLWATPPELPGRRIDEKHVADTVRRFVNSRFFGRQFTYRQDKAFYYVFIDRWQYLLFSPEGTVRGFRFRTMQPTQEVASCIPVGMSSYIRTHYPGYYTAFLPEKEGFLVKLYGRDDKLLYLDGEGRLLKEE